MFIVYLTIKKVLRILTDNDKKDITKCYVRDIEAKSN